MGEVVIGREVRVLQHIPRWAMIRTIKEFSVASHSHMVAIIADRLAEHVSEFRRFHHVLNMQNLSMMEFRLRVLRGAVLHDLDELLSGDIAHPAKTAYRQVPGAKEAYKAWVDERMAERVPWYVEDTNELVRNVIGISDLLEAYLFLLEEQRMGNQEVNGVASKVYEGLMNAVDYFQNVFGPEVRSFVRAAAEEIVERCDIVVQNVIPQEA